MITGQYIDPFVEALLAAHPAMYVSASTRVWMSVCRAPREAWARLHTLGFTRVEYDVATGVAGCEAHFVWRQPELHQAARVEAPDGSAVDPASVVGVYTGGSVPTRLVVRIDRLRPNATQDGAYYHLSEGAPGQLFLPDPDGELVACFLDGEGRWAARDGRLVVLGARVWKRPEPAETAP